MDLGGKPDGNNITGDDINGIHHDPLNENLEETWSALGEHDVQGTSDSDPGMLPPPIPVLPTTLGSIIGQPISHRGMSELSVLRAPNRTIAAASINQEGIEDSEESMAGKRKEADAPEKLKTTPGGFRIFSRKGTVGEEVEEDSNTFKKRKSSKTSQNDNASAKEEGTSFAQKEEEINLDMFFQTMYNTTKKLSLIKQIELRREIRQLVLNAEKKDQVAEKKEQVENGGQKAPQETKQTTKKSRFSKSKR